MIEVIIDKSVNDIINIVHELVEQFELVRDVDFEFAYFGTKVDAESGTLTHKSHTRFRFKDPAIASWFVLKYKNEI